MTECLKFYRNFSIYSATLKNIHDQMKDFEKSSSSMTSQDIETIKKITGKSDDEMIEWFRNYKLAIYNVAQFSAAAEAVEVIETGMRTLTELDKITNNKVTYDFDLKKIKRQTSQKAKLAKNELLKYLQQFNLSYPQLKERVNNLDGKNSN